MERKGTSLRQTTLLVLILTVVSKVQRRAVSLVPAVGQHVDGNRLVAVLHQRVRC